MMETKSIHEIDFSIRSLTFDEDKEDGFSRKASIVMKPRPSIMIKRQTSRVSSDYSEAKPMNKASS